MSDSKKNTARNKNTARQPAAREAGKRGGERGGGARRSGGEPIKALPGEGARSSRFAHQFVPYILFVLALFAAACYIFVAAGAEGSVGALGRWLNDILCGLLGWPAFLIPAVLINLALFWRRYVDMEMVRLKLTLSFLILLSVSSLVHVAALAASGGAGFDISDFFGGTVYLWQDGIALRGGGVLGGLLGELSSMAFGPVGSMIIFIPVTGVLLMFLFGTTPGGIWLWIRYKAKLAAERRAARQIGEEDDDEGEAPVRPGVFERGRRAPKEKDVKSKRSAASRREERRLRREAALGDAGAPADDAVFTEGQAPVAHASRHAAAVGAPPAPEGPETSSQTVSPAEEIAAAPAAASPSVPAAGAGGTVILSLDPVCSAKEEPQISQDPEYFDIVETINRGPGRDGAAHKKEGIENKYEKAGVIPLGMIVSSDNISELTDAGDEEPPATQETAYIFPPYALLAPDTNPKEADFTAELQDNARRLMETLGSFNVRIKEINYSRGPTITRYELKPDAGVRVRSISNLVDDIALSLATTGVRIEAPIPGKAAVGVEVPNRTQATVYLRSLIESQTYADTPSRLAVCLGEDVAGKPIYFNIDKMPHLLIAGATGMGKSVCINSLIVSLLYKSKPDEVKLILVDPKKVEFNVYKEMPHLYVPVVSDPKKAAGVLATAVAEMERRFEMIEALNVRDITNYNRIAETDPDLQPIPRIVIIIDELADLMMTAPDDVEIAICRLAQKARAAGIHLIIGTQRPSVDVITGLIKANIPSRIAFTVASQVDSRTIIDIGGAEKLIGRGDMLFAPVGAAKPMRVQGAFVGELEVERIVEFLKQNNSKAKYDDEFIRRIELEAERCGSKKGGGSANIEDVEGDGTDPKLREAIELAIESGKISTSLMQRRLEVGYGRAAKIIDQMEKMGYVSAADGNKPRRVLITKEQFMEKVVNDEVV